MSKYTEPVWSSSALVTIDTQCDTLDGQSFEIPGTSAILPRMTMLLQAFRKANKPIAHIVRIYTPDGVNVDLCRRELVEQAPPWYWRAPPVVSSRPTCSFRVVLAEDAISGLYDQGRLEMRNIGVELLRTDQIIDAVRQDSKT